VGGLNYAPAYQPRQLDLDGPGMVLDALWSQEMATEGGTHVAGLRQTLEVPRQSQVMARVYARAETSTDQAGQPGGYALSIGLDPLGGADPNAPRIVWSPPVTATEAWVPLQLDQPVEGPSITFYLKGQALRPVARNASWWDATCLRVVGAAGEPTLRPSPIPPPTRTLAPGEPTFTPERATVEALATQLVFDLMETATAALATPEPLDDVGPPDVATAVPIETVVAVAPPPSPTDRVRANAGLIFLGLAAFIVGVLISTRRRRRSPS
jgi:hypothetical protein